MTLADCENAFEIREDCKASYGKNGMVSTAFPNATEAGVEILKFGGNAVDAACASALALGVCEPQASGLGGQTMMMIDTGKKIIAVDGSSRAPSLAHINALYENDKKRGYRAATVPSTLAALGYVQKRYGRLNWEDIVKPAVSIAENGYRITKLQAFLQKREKKNFLKVESGSGAKYFLKDGQPHKEGDLFKQSDLACLLKDIGKKGVKWFYQKEPAKIIDADMREFGGLLRYDDLAFIPWPIERKPLMGSFREMKIYTMPPPGAGRTLLFMLSMLNSISAKRLHKNKIQFVHILMEVFRKALLERFDRPYDPNFYPQLGEVEKLTGKMATEFIKAIVKSVDPYIPIRETSDESKGDTTHLSVIDGTMAVSLTQSIERVYGSKAAAGGLGFLYNNYLMDYEYKFPEHPFYLRPNSVPWASVAPSVIHKNKKLWMAVGSPGSERSLSAVAQFLINISDKKMNIYDAVKAPRMHCSLGGKVSLESNRIEPEIISFLSNTGYRIDKKEDFAFYLGAVHAVLNISSGLGYQGVAEVRRDGICKGY